MKIYLEFVSQKLRNLREEKKLTQEALAEQLGISRQSIISVEKGKCLPSLPLAMRMAELFNLTLEDFFSNNKKRGGEKMTHYLTPWSPLRDMDGFFDDDDFPTRKAIARRLNFPAISIKQDDKNLVLTADIPGIKEDDLEIELGENFIDISGEKKEEETKEDEDYFYQEVSYGLFHRRISLPTEINSEKAEATIKDGQLKLVMPKLAPSKPKATKIKVKKA